MKCFRGTPGPWKVKEVDDDEISEMSSTMVVAGSLVLACIGPTSYTYLKSDNANANLIAAAPDLLNELQRLRDYVINICGVDDGDCDSEHPLMSSQAAIIKALGEE